MLYLTKVLDESYIEIFLQLLKYHIHFLKSLRNLLIQLKAD